ncbi:unnamed protein product [Triticum turgidum subsp. durum]|uniref:Fatty acyl-CoA reductase n=1 Tax=Triticum turgidum subsp. durum TaxID=4567 RepID=A0A9R0R7U2_TRITD|nr:unnamed protein product [Triticum turgidum subsp. durum]
MIGEMDADSVVGYFRGKSILITGSTGFLGKVLVEKILRVQPDVKKLFLLIRAPDAESAKLRIQTEIIDREIFHVLKEKHGVRFNNFIEEKICPLVGDIIYENFGLDNAQLGELSKDIDVIVNGAATTNFFERYDVAFDVNVLGVKHICAFATKCPKLRMLLHVSTAYVAGEQEGIIPEKPILMGETIKVGTHLDIESELNLIKETMQELKASCSMEKAGRKTMKELGLKRTIDSVVIGYAKQTLPFFLVDLDLIMDVIPGDMVVNAMMVAMVAHSEDQRYFNDNPPCTGRNGERVRLKKMRFFSSIMWFRLYMAFKYMLPLEMLRLVNIALCGVFSRVYNELSRKFRFMMQLSELYAPYTLFKGCFDDMNLDKLRMAMKKDNQNNNGAYYFDFDPKYIDWEDYFYSVHIPGVLKYTRD